MTTGFSLEQVTGVPEHLLYRVDEYGERRPTETAQIMVSACADVGMTKITRLNSEKFFRRTLSLALARGLGPLPINPHQKASSSFLTPSHVQAFIGLTVVTPAFNDNTFAKKVVQELKKREKTLADKALYGPCRTYFIRLTRLVKVSELLPSDRDFFTAGTSYKRDHRVYPIPVYASQLTGDTAVDTGDILRRFWNSVVEEISRPEDFHAAIDRIEEINPYEKEPL